MKLLRTMDLGEFEILLNVWVGPGIPPYLKVQVPVKEAIEDLMALDTWSVIQQAILHHLPSLLRQSG